MNLKELLENRHTATLWWCEPWPARSKDGNELVANMTVSATVHDCCNLQRMIPEYYEAPDFICLYDFIITHFASLTGGTTNLMDLEELAAEYGFDLKNRIYSTETTEEI